MSTSATSGTPKAAFPSSRTPISARLDGMILRRAARTGLGVAGWGLLAFFALSTAYLVWWLILALVLVGQGPSSSGPLPILVPLLAVCSLALAGLVAKFISSLRRVAAAMAVMVALVWGIDLVWALAVPDWALYQARAVAWGESDVNDYQKFPQRRLPSPRRSHFPEPDPLRPQNIEYKSGGQTKQTADFRRSSSRRTPHRSS
jgi:hypothetical protein